MSPARPSLNRPLFVVKGDTIVFRTELEACHERIERLEADLLECRAFLDGLSDVVDGDYGVPAPNRAMSLCSMIDETLSDEVR